jgi:hypothetical protein
MEASFDTFMIWQSIRYHSWLYFQDGVDDRVV